MGLPAKGGSRTEPPTGALLGTAKALQARDELKIRHKISGLPRTASAPPGRAKFATRAETAGCPVTAKGQPVRARFAIQRGISVFAPTGLRNPHQVFGSVITDPLLR